MKKIRVAITDDHLLVIKGLQDLLGLIPEVEVVAAFMTVEEAQNKIGDVNPDVLLLDLNLPDGDGVSLCKEISTRHPKIKVLALTTYNQVSLIKSVMRNGAMGFLIKNVSVEILREAIVTVHSDKQYLQPEIQELLLQHAINNKKSTPAFQPVLSRREKEILQLIVAEQTTQEIADRLSISVKTVETHRTHLMQKLDARNLAGLVKAAIERGLC